MSSASAALMERPALGSADVSETMTPQSEDGLRAARRKLRLSFRSAMVVTTAAAIVLGGSSAMATAQPAYAMPAQISHAMPAHAAGTPSAPAPTEDQLGFASWTLGSDVEAEIERAMIEQAEQEGVPKDQMVGGPIAAAAIVAAAWCASGALGSVPTSVLDDATNGGTEVDYVRNAVIGCLVGNVGSWAWKVLPGPIKNKMIEAVIAFVIKYHR